MSTPSKPTSGVYSISSSVGSLVVPLSSILIAPPSSEFAEGSMIDPVLGPSEPNVSLSKTSITLFALFYWLCMNHQLQLVHY